MQRKITMVVSPKGETEIVSSGFHGGECQLATKPLTSLLGETVADNPTAEMYEEVVAPQIQTEIG